MGRCSTASEPVCGRSGSTFTSFINRCVATCAGTIVDHAGPCKAGDAIISASTVTADANNTPASSPVVLIAGSSAPSAEQTTAADDGSVMAAAEVDVSTQALVPVITAALRTNASGTGSPSSDKALPQAVAASGADIAAANVIASCITGCGAGTGAVVCGEDDATYNSSCIAACLRVKIRHMGACHMVNITSSEQAAGAAVNLTAAATVVPQGLPVQKEQAIRAADASGGAGSQMPAEGVVRAGTAGSGDASAGSGQAASLQVVKPVGELAALAARQSQQQRRQIRYPRGG